MENWNSFKGKLERSELYFEMCKQSVTEKFIAKTSQTTTNFSAN